MANKLKVNTDCTSTTDPSPQQVVCDASVTEADTLAPSFNDPVRKAGEFKVPVVIAEFDVFINLESSIHLNTPAYEIKRIDKEVFLNQARFVPTKFDYYKGKVRKGTVFLQGYLRKNIEYASPTCDVAASSNAIGGVINDTTARIQFLTSTVVYDFINYPIIQPSPTNETTRYFDKNRLGKNIREADRRTVEYLNEPVYAEIVETDVIDADINAEGTPIDDFNNEEIFQDFIDKAVIRIRVKLLQKQQIKHHHYYIADNDEPVNDEPDTEE